MKRYIKSAKGNPKNIIVYVSQEYVPGYGWEDIVEYDDMSSESLKEAKQDVKDYLDNGYNARVIKRKLANPNYAEPENNITYDEAVAWVESCPYKADELYMQGGKNYVIEHKAQVFIGEDDVVRVRNIRGNRTKEVHSLEELEKEINRLVG